MATLQRGETSDCTNPVLDIYLRKTGAPVDVAVLEVQIFDISTPSKQLTPVQVYPTIAGTRETLAPTVDCPAGNRIAAGHFFADWTVPVLEELGSHEIRWFWRETGLSPEQTFSEEFEVLDVIAPSPDDTYITVLDLRDIGITETMLSNTAAEALIRLCQAMLDRATRQFFKPRTYQFKFDGTDSDTAHFGLPIISVEWLKINNDGSELNTDYYKVYNGRTYPDDRRNPRIKLVRSDGYRDIYTAPLTIGELRFRKGRQNCEVRGVWGFVEDDGSVPLMIKEAMIRLVVERMAYPAYTPPGSIPIPPPPASVTVLEEATDGHRIKYGGASSSSSSSVRAGISGLTSDAFVQDVIKMFRAPIAGATPAHWSGR